MKMLSRRISGLCIGILLAGSPILGAEDAPPVSPAPEAPPTLKPSRVIGSANWVHEHGVATALYLSQDAKFLASFHGGSAVLLIWNSETGALLRSADAKRNEKSQSDQEAGIALSPDGRLIAIWDGWDQVVHVEEAATGKQIHTLEQLKRTGEFPFATFGRLLFTPDGKSLALVTTDMVCLWDTGTGKESRRFRTTDKVVHRSWASFTSDGKALRLVASERGEPFLSTWDLATGKETRRTKLSSTLAVQDLAFALDGNSLVAYFGEGTYFVFDSATGEERCHFSSVEGRNMRLTISPKGKSVAIVNSEEVYLYNGRTGKKECWLQTEGVEGSAKSQIPSPILGSVVFHPDGNILLASGTRQFHRWDLATRKELPRTDGHAGTVDQLAFTADARTLVSVSLASPTADRSLRWWNVSTGKSRRVLPLARELWAKGNGPWVGLPDPVSYLAVVGADSFEVELLNEDEDHKTTSFLPNQAGAAPVALSSDGRYLALTVPGTWNIKEKLVTGYVSFWDIAVGKEVRRFACTRPMSPDQENLNHIHERRFPPDVIAISPDAKTLTAIVNGGGLWAWDVPSGLLLSYQGSFEGSWTNHVRMSRDGRTLITLDGKTGQNVIFWEVLTGLKRREVPLPDLKTRTPIVAVSPDGRVIASASGPDAEDGKKVQSLFLTDTATGKLLAQLPGHQGRVLSLAFAPDGHTLASGGSDTTIHLWDVSEFLPPPAKPRKLSEETLNDCWTALAGADASAAAQAIQTLQGGTQTVSFLRCRIGPARTPEPARVARLLADLDHKQFQVRKEATEELERLGELVEAELLKFLETKPPLEVAQRIQKVLAGPHNLQALRTVEMLGQLGTVEASELLKELAGGAPKARLTQEAKAALSRLCR